MDRSTGTAGPTRRQSKRLRNRSFPKSSYDNPVPVDDDLIDDEVNLNEQDQDAEPIIDTQDDEVNLNEQNQVEEPLTDDDDYTDFVRPFGNLYDTNLKSSTGLRKEIRSKMNADIPELTPENINISVTGKARRFKMRANKNKRVRSKVQLVDEEIDEDRAAEAKQKVKDPKVKTKKRKKVEKATTEDEVRKGNCNTVRKERKKKKTKVIEEVKNPTIKFDEYDLIFFPMLVDEHYYLLCFNMKIDTYEVMDNIRLGKAAPKIYGRSVHEIKKHFTKYLKDQQFTLLAGKLSTFRPSYPTLKWQTLRNYTDCGIFLMRHMETYKGSLKNWETQFKEEKMGQKSQIDRLRVKYANTILTSHLNEGRDHITKEAKHMYNRIAKENLMSMVLASSSKKPKSKDSSKKPDDIVGTVLFPNDSAKKT